MAITAESEQALFELDLGENGGMLKPQSVDEIESWLAREVAFWAWLKEEPAAQRSELNALRKRFDSTTNEIRSSLTRLKSNPSDEGGRQHTRQQISKWFREQKVIHSHSTMAAWIEDLRTRESPLIAAAALAFVHKEPLPFNDVEFAQGGLEAMLYLRGVHTEVPTAVNEGLAKVHQEFSDQLASAKKQVAQALRKIENKLGVQSRKVEQGTRLAAEAIRKMRSASKRHMEEVDKLYKEAISLAAPVEYWAKKRRKHRWLTIGFGSVFVAYVLGMSIAGSMAYSFLRSSQSAIVTLPYWHDMGYGVVVLLMVAIAIIAALARGFWRLTMSQLHLGNDADERVTMVQTFLALRAEGHATEAQIQTVFERLCTPAVDGIVKDDLGPVTLTESTLSRITGRR